MWANVWNKTSQLRIIVALKYYRMIEQFLQQIKLNIV